MDVHRCRFVPYPASAINALAFSHRSPAAGEQSRHISLRLAIGRANGDIEIWNPRNGLWHQEIIIRGGKDRSIDGIVWTQEQDEEGTDGKTVPGKLRLFSIGYTSAVTEWDLEKGTARRHASGQHGDIWCLGAQPAVPRPASQKGTQNQKLVAGTIDGCLALYSIDDDDLHLQRILVKSSSKRTRMVSIAFQTRTVAIVGCSDSSIRAYDMRNGSLLRKMTLGSDLAGGAKDIIVWSVKCLPNGDIVSGDSTGQVCIWDGKTYTQAQRIQSHDQDVLSLATSADGSTIRSGGMDRRTVLYKAVTGTSGRWAKASHRRYHKHDVKAMASFEGDGLSIVVSGGPDASPVVLPLRKAGSENHRTLSYLPQQAPIVGASKARLLASWWGREVRIWHLRQSVHELLDHDVDSAVQKNHKLVGRVLVKGEANINSASISQDGRLLIVATMSEVKAFSLEFRDQQRRGDLRVSKVKSLPQEWAQGASMVQISPDGLWVCAIQDGSQVRLATVQPTAPHEGAGHHFHALSQRLNRGKAKVSQQRHAAGLGSYSRTITQIAFSADSKVLAVADLAGQIDTWILSNRDGATEGVKQAASSASSSEASESEQDEGGEAYPWITNPRSHLLPRLPAAPALISFSETCPGSPRKHGGAEDDDYTLLTVTTAMQLILLHPLRGSIADWSRRNPSSRLPNAFRTNRDIVKCVVWQGPRVWLYGVSAVFMLDLSVDHSSGAIAGGEDQYTGQTGSKKRKRGQNSGAGDRMEKGALVPTRMRTAMGGEEPVQWMDVDMEDADHTNRGAPCEVDDDVGNDDYDDSGELQNARDSQRANGTIHETNGVRRSAWYTYKYRPILGVVPLDCPESSNGPKVADEEHVPRPFEVALVERPIWDVDLPPRYFGEDEYER